MKFGAILLLSFGLAADATAVAAARGMAARRILGRHVFLVAAFFGGFQALMPLIGWGVGSRIGPFVQAWAHWIALFVLAGVGAKMIFEARAAKPNDVRADDELFGLKAMFLLAVATSLDALVVGITLPLLDANLFLSVTTIGITTAAMSAIGLFAGRRFGVILGRRVDVAGGVVLIGLGIKILVEHFRSPP